MKNGSVEDGTKEGRPTKYKPEYCEQIIEYFSIPPYKDVDIPHYKNDQVQWTEKKRIPNDLPTFHEFAYSIGLSDTVTMLEWCKKHPEFLSAYTRAKELQQYFIAKNALNNGFNANFSQFLLHNISNWKIKQEKEQEGQINITLMLPPNERDQRQLGQGNIIQIEGETVSE